MSKIIPKDNPLQNDYSISNIIANNVKDVPLIINPNTMESIPYIKHYKERSIYDSSCIIFWAPILDNAVPGIEPYRYYINTRGEIYDIYRQGYMTPILHNKGYLQCHFYTPYSNQRSTTRKIHRVVMISFYYFPGCEQYEVNHIDGNKSNNIITNLEWVTHSENIIHAINMGLKTIFGRNDLRVDLTDDDITKILELNKQGYSHDEIIKIFEDNGKRLGKVHISQIINKRNRLAYFNDLYHVRS